MVPGPLGHFAGEIDFPPLLFAGFFSFLFSGFFFLFKRDGPESFLSRFSPFCRASTYQVFPDLGWGELDPFSLVGSLLPGSSTLSPFCEDVSAFFSPFLSPSYHVFIFVFFSLCGACLLFS